MTSTERRTRDREQKKQNILNFAQDLIFTQGSDNTTVDQIAKASGYTKRSIYLYFKDKEEILFEITARGQRIFTEYLLNNPQINGSESLQTAEHFAWAIYHYSLDYPEYFELLMNYEFNRHLYTGKPADLEGGERRCHENSLTYGKIALEAIEKDMTERGLSIDFTPKQLLLIFWGQLFGVAQILMIRRKDFERAYNTTPEKLFREFSCQFQKMYDSSFKQPALAT